MKKGLRLGVDLGGTLVKLALVNERGVVKAIKKVETAADPQKLTATIRATAGPWLSQKILGTGVGMAGDVDPARGVIRFAPNLGWKNVPLKTYFQKAGFPKPLFFENDATAAAWGAYHVELKRRCRHLIVLTLGTGVGGGLVLNGELYRGATGTAGELGHVVVDPEGPACPCGNRGCLEQYVGGRALVKWAREEMSREGRAEEDHLSPKGLFEAAQKGHPVARRAWERAGRALGIALADFLNIFNPDTILFTGGVAGAAPLLLPIARREMDARAFQTPRRAVTFKVARQSADLGVVGAALLVE